MTAPTESKATFRQQLAQMSFEEIQELKQQVGLKSFSQLLKMPAISEPADSCSSEATKRPFKRENKNRPREMSSKVKVSRLRDVVGLKSGEAKKSTRDPRFDSLCGEFEEKAFRKNYGFLDDIKKKEKAILKQQLDEEQDPARIRQIKYLIQRQENQEREKKRLEQRKAQLSEERKHNQHLIQQGQKPHFSSRSERKAKDLVQQFETLRKSGKLDQYLKRKSKKNLHKERKKFQSST